MNAIDLIDAALRGERAPGVYRLDMDTPIEQFVFVASQYNYDFGLIDTSGVTSKRAFLQRVGEALQFPSYYGHNWDAFADCVTDLSWLTGVGYLIVFEHLEMFAASDPQAWVIALDILHEAVAYWRSVDTPMFVLLRGAGQALESIPLLS